MRWIVFAISRNGNDWSMRIDNGEGIAIELPCLNKQAAITIADVVCENMAGDNVSHGQPVEWNKQDDDQKGMQLAYGAGAFARMLNHPPNCPFGPDVLAKYYEAWHQGWNDGNELVTAKAWKG